MRLWKSQKKFLTVQAQSPNVAYAASRGTGKTYALAAAMNLQVAAQPGVYAILAPRWRTLAGNVMLQLMSSGRDLGIPVKPGRYADRPCAYIGDSPIAFLTTFTASSIANFRGDSLKGAWMEEATLQTEDAFHAVESTLRDGDNPFLWLSYNRTSPTSWVKRLIEDGHEDEAGNTFSFDLVEGFTWENKLLPRSYIQRLKRLPGHYRMRDLLNRWAVASGLVYPIFQTTTATFDPNKPYYLAYDPAPVNVQCALCFQPQSDHWAIVGEIYTRRGATLRDAKDALDQIEAKWGKPRAAVIDPAAYEHVFEATFYKHWNVLAPSTKEHAITVPILRLLLEQGRVRINPSAAPNTIAEFYSVIYDEKSEKIAEGQEDHATDAARYISEFIEAEIIPRVITPGNQFMREWDMQYANR